MHSLSTEPLVDGFSNTPMPNIPAKHEAMTAFDPPQSPSPHNLDIYVPNTNTMPPTDTMELDVDLAVYLKASDGPKDSDYDSNVSIHYLPSSPTPGPCPPSLPPRINPSCTVTPDNCISGPPFSNPGGKPPNTVDLLPPFVFTPNP